MKQAMFDGRSAKFVAKRGMAFRAVLFVAWMMLPALLLTLPAAAQNSHPPAVDSTPARDVQAPVGHRQPTAADVVGMASPTERDVIRQKRDRVLDRRLQICRGC